MNPYKLLVASDIHYSSAGEQARGYAEDTAITQPLLRLLAQAFRHYIWMRNPHAHNHLLDEFLARAGEADLVIANGDFSLDSAFIGVADDPACQSVRECLNRLRGRFGERFLPVLGDHELGKMSLFGRVGGLRLASWRRAINELGFQPLWQRDLGGYRLLGVTSSLVALPVNEPEILPEERAVWHELRAAHLAGIRQAFETLKPDQRILLFCHDPTALPFLWQEEAIRCHAHQIALTMIGHLHSGLILWKCRRLSGMPPINFLGNSIRRMSAALRRARDWRPFKVTLCPALAGIQMFKGGGFYEVELDAGGAAPPRLHWHKILRRKDCSGCTQNQ